jgi:hypothetical protein
MMQRFALRVVSWGPVAQRAVRPDPVVVDAPHADLRARLFEIGEPVLESFNGRLRDECLNDVCSYREDPSLPMRMATEWQQACIDPPRLAK